MEELLKAKQRAFVSLEMKELEEDISSFKLLWKSSSMGISQQMVKDLLQFKEVEVQEEQSQLNQMQLVAQE